MSKFGRIIRAILASIFAIGHMLMILPWSCYTTIWYCISAVFDGQWAGIREIWVNPNAPVIKELFETWKEI